MYHITLHAIYSYFTSRLDIFSIHYSCVICKMFTSSFTGRHNIYGIAVTSQDEAKKEMARRREHARAALDKCYYGVLIS